MWVLTDERDGKFASFPFCSESEETLMILAKEWVEASLSAPDDVAAALEELRMHGRWEDGDCVVRFFHAEEFKPGGD